MFDSSKSALGICARSQVLSQVLPQALVLPLVLPLVLAQVLVLALVLTPAIAGASSFAPPRAPIWAVASSFAPAARALALTARAPAALASGTLYHQIERGAPYDLVVLAGADWAARSRAAEMGRLSCLASAPLAVWTRNASFSVDTSVGGAQLAQLLRDENTRVLLPDPRIAPAGVAARQLLADLGVADRPDLLYAGSAAHSLHLARQGAADLVLLPLPLLSKLREGRVLARVSHCCQLPYHALLLNDSAAGRALFAALTAPAAHRVLAALGYSTSTGAAGCGGGAD